MKRFLPGIAAAALLAILPASTSAHHSTAMFEWGKEITLKKATVVRWEWTNPHTFLYVTTKGSDGKDKKWAFEGMSPNHLTRGSWSKRTLKTGDVIDLTYYPLRDGRNGGFNVTITLPDGKTLKQISFD
ncbi:DUF6152 family protein [Altererythrobacter fulvus]|uniref:DUF6152 family protein n=1 Tax=Caenibius fulvus TaxID=2126012 RepID=UPI003018FFB7